MGQHDGEMSKLSGSSERFPSHDENALQGKPSVNQDFPLRTSPRSSRVHQKPDPMPLPPSSPPHSMPRQPFEVVESTAHNGSGRNIDGLPRVMDPMNPPQVASPLGAPSPAPTSPLFPRAQPITKRPTTSDGLRRPSTAGSIQTTSSNATVKTGPLLKLKRSFSQLRLNSFSKQHSDVTSPSPGHLPSTPKSTNIPQTLVTASATPPSSSSSPPVPPPKSAPTSYGSAPHVPSTTHSTTSTIPPSTTHPNMITSGPLAPMSIHKPLPPPGGTLQRRTQDQPPKLSLAPVNHRISLTMPMPITTEAGSARFSPTVISRPLPLPLLNLPTLAPRSDSLTGASTSAGVNSSVSGGGGSAVGRIGGSGSGGPRTRVGVREDQERRAGKAHLKSMPALPLQGTGRGVKGHEEMDEDEDDSAEEDDEDYEEDSSRLEDSSRSGFDSSASSLASIGQEQHILPASSSGGSRSREKERERTPSTGSSYHSALSGFSPPDSAGFNAVPIIKHPTPPRVHTQIQASSTSATTTSGRASASSLPQASWGQTQSVSRQGLSHYAPQPQHLPEVDTSKLDLSFLSSPAPSAGTSPTVIDVKGKGKARDYSSPDPNSTFSIVTGGTRGAGAAYHYDPSKTPTTATVAAGSSFREFGFNNLNPQVQSQKDKPNSPGSVTVTGVQMQQSPTGTLRQQYGSHVSGGVGGGGDYFSLEGTTTSPQSSSAHSRSHNPPPGSYHHHQPSLSSNRPHHQLHPYSFRHSVAIPPASFGVQTPRASVAGMKSPTGLLSGLPTPKRSSTLLVGTGDDGGGGAVYTMPKMYKRASQSLIDLHTLETKERKRMMEEEMRVEEEMELAKMREKEKMAEKKKKEEERRRRSEDEKIKGDDDEAGERKDQLGIPVNSTITPNTGTNNNIANAAGAAGQAASTALKKQNRLSTASHYLRRRRSMPMYDESSEPPPYPSFAFQHPSSKPKYTIMPREDEGRERLPPYENPIYLKAIMPRKLEFSAPGVQAKDRKWRRVMCVLEGTVFRVYKCPPGHAGVGVLGEWWEKQVGAGDVSLQPSHSGTVSTIQIETRETRRLAEERRDIERQIQRIMKAEGGDEVVNPIGGGGYGGMEDDDPEVVIVPTPSQDSGYGSMQAPGMKTSTSKSKFAQLLKPGRNHGRSRSDVHMSERNTPNESPRPSFNAARSGRSTPVSSSGRSLSPFPGSGSMRAQTPMSSSSQSITMDSGSGTGHMTPTSSAFSTFRRQQALGLSPSSPTQQYLYTNREREFLPDPDPGDLVREYTLQNAESGIGNDYSKRKNVIRLRLEGEQFLLQARDVTGVVEWIEVRIGFFRLCELKSDEVLL